jgi:hypothetical protein
MAKQNSGGVCESLFQFDGDLNPVFNPSQP